MLEQRGDLHLLQPFEASKMRSAGCSEASEASQDLQDLQSSCNIQPNAARNSQLTTHKHRYRYRIRAASVGGNFIHFARRQRKLGLARGSKAIKLAIIDTVEILSRLALQVSSAFERSFARK